MPHLLERSLAAVGAIATALLTANTLSGQSPPNAYQQLRLLEAKYPRIPYDSILVGTFDAATGKFTGQVSTNYPATKDCTPDIRGKPRCTTERGESTAPIVAARARKIGLIFKIANPQGPFTATANGLSVTAAANKPSVTVPVAGNPVPGDASHSRWSVAWRVSSGGKSYRDSLIIDRMSFGVGAFTIPVLPIAIVYDPPQDSAHSNAEVFSTSNAHGSLVTMSLTSQGGFGADATTQFQPFVDFYDGLKKAGEAVSAAGQAYPPLAVAGQVLTAAAGILPAIFGTASATQQNTTAQATGNTHQLVVTTTQTYKTAQLGPGRGDVMVYFKNMRMAWFSRCCVPLSLLPLGADMVGSSTVSELQADLAAIRSGARATGQQSHLDSLSIQALLALDPFVKGGNNALLPSQRFDSLSPPIGLSSVPVKQSFTVTETAIQRRGTTTISERVEKDEAGLLGSLELGFGPDSSGVITTTITHSNLAEATAQQTLQVDVLLGGRGLDTSVVNAYYDRVFGTIAVRVVPSGTDVVAGDLAADSTSSTASAQTAQAMELRSIVRSVPRSVQDARVTTIVPAGMGVSSPIAGRILTLTAAGRTYRTTTDERGHYVFRIPHSATATEATIAVDRSSLTQKITLSAPRLTVPLIRVR